MELQEDTNEDIYDEWMYENSMSLHLRPSINSLVMTFFSESFRAVLYSFCRS